MPRTEWLHVLVVSAEATRALATREAAGAWSALVNIEWTGTWHEALRLVREMPAQLVLVDCNHGLVGGAALARHLARHQPRLDVIAFADQPVAPRPTQPGAWPWADLPFVLHEWLEIKTERCSGDDAITQPTP